MEKNDENYAFYYSRDEHLKKYPELQKLYDGSMKKRRGIFRVLLDSPGGKFMVIAILSLCAVVVAAKLREIDFSSAPTNSGEFSFGEIHCVVKAVRFDENVFVTLSLTGTENSRELSVDFIPRFEDGATGSPQTFYEIFDGGEKKIRATFTNSAIHDIIVKVSDESDVSFWTAEIFDE